MDCSIPGFAFLTISQSLLKLMSIESGCHPTISSSVNPFFLPSIFPRIRVFSNESVPHMRLINDWSFRFSISPFNEYSRLISCRLNWFDLLAVQGDTQESSSACILLFSSVETVILSSQSLLSTLPCDPNVSMKLDSLFLKCDMYSQSHWKLCLCSSLCLQYVSSL